jgi:hypothetical protein
MRFPVPVILVAAVIGGSGDAVAQPLACPPTAAAATRPCDAFHYHVQKYRPENRQFVEVYGVNQFATLGTCERAREVQVSRNLAVVDYFKRVKGDERYEPDRVGGCHCDMTTDRASSNYLTDVQRAAQLRTAEEVRLRVRERLLDSGLTSSNELVRGLIIQHPSAPLLSTPRIVPIPDTSAVAGVNAPSDLRPTKAIEASRSPTLSSLDLPLVEVAIPEGIASSEPPLSEVTVDPAAETPATTESDPLPTEISAPAEESVPAVDEGAEAFISYETQRIQNVLKASSAIVDENVKSKIFEACMQRIEVLSNLRGLIQGSGMRSRLAVAARTAQNESDRLALVGRLFGSDITSHWAPRDAADVILDPRPEVENDPERALRDSSGRISEQLKRRAFYLLLARSQPTEEQQLWLITVAESFLR